MPDVNPTPVDVVLLGNPALDRFLYRLKANGGAGDGNWEEGRSWKLMECLGGVFLTEEMLIHLDLSVRTAGPNGFVSTTQLQRLEALAELEVTDLAAEDKARHDPSVEMPLRVSCLDGYREVKVNINEIDIRWSGLPSNIIDENFNLLLINDAGMALRRDSNIWRTPLEIAMKRKLPIIYKLHRPFDGNEIFRFLQDQPDDNLVSIIQADDLRATGAAISRGLSWEATVEDLLADAQRPDQPLSQLIAASAYVLVVCDLEGVIIISRNGEVNACHLVFDPARAEGDTARDLKGLVNGKSSAFTAVFVSELLRKGLSVDGVVQSAIKAIGATRGYAHGSFRLKDNILHPPSIPTSFVEATTSYRRTEVPWPQRGKKTNVSLVPPQTNVTEVARAVVKQGSSALDGIPSARFGNLVTVDRKEIEAYRAIQLLIRGYLSAENRSKPLSLAIFGQPGSGKSFGIKEIAIKSKLEFRTFNMSEAGPDDLPGFFHEIRDVNLAKKTAIFFFDEFDSGDMELLASFLAPMQDGTFRQGARVHPVGRGIFVFAGGTSKSMDEFLKKDDIDKYKGLKITDFASRLSGYLDVVGPNKLNNDDQAWVLRRAVLLRSLVERHMSAIIHDPTKTASIDDAVIEGFLRPETFKHGARSIEAIVAMSAAMGRPDRFVLSDLPSRSQLELHVDPDVFLGSST